MVVMLPGVWELLKAALYIPVSSATSERSFSALRRLKTYLRRTMWQHRLTNLAILHIEQELVDQVDMDAVVDKFASQGRQMNLIH